MNTDELLFFNRKPRTQKGKRVLENREPKTIEDAKNAIFIEGRKSSQAVRNFMKDVYSIKKPNCKKMRHNNDFTPFDDATTLEQ